MSELLQSTPSFEINNDQKAEWAVKKIAEARADCDRWVAFYKEQIKIITEQTDFETLRLESMLAEYFATLPHKSTKTQESYALPSGKLILKKQQPEFVRNDKEVIEWLKENDGKQYIKIEESLDWANLKKDTTVVGKNIVTTDGEIVKGIEVQIRPDKFVVEVK